MVSNNVDRAQVEAWLGSLDAEMARLENELAPLLEERSRLEERAKILGSLLKSLDGESRPSPASGAPRAAAPQSPASVKDYVESHVIELLEESDRDRLHINEIYARFRDKGYEVPGAGKPVNITSHIRISDRIRSPKRGYYGLIERVGDIPPRSTQKKKTK